MPVLKVPQAMNAEKFAKNERGRIYYFGRFRGNRTQQSTKAMMKAYGLLMMAVGAMKSVGRAWATETATGATERR